MHTILAQQGAIPPAIQFVSLRPQIQEVAWKAAPRGSKPCPGDCNGVGDCDRDWGRCRCPAGEKESGSLPPETKRNPYSSCILFIFHVGKSGLHSLRGAVIAPDLCFRAFIGYATQPPSMLRPQALPLTQAPSSSPRSGWTGADCKTVQLRPCTNRQRKPSDLSDVPLGHIDAEGRDLDWSAPGEVPSRCAGQSS